MARLDRLLKDRWWAILQQRHDRKPPRRAPKRQIDATNRGTGEAPFPRFLSVPARSPSALKLHPSPGVCEIGIDGTGRQERNV